MQLWWNICCREGNRFDNTEGWIITREIEGHALNVSALVAHMAEGIMLNVVLIFFKYMLSLIFPLLLYVSSCVRSSRAPEEIRERAG